MVKRHLKAATFAGLIAVAGAGGTLAADLPSRAAPPIYAAPPVFTWTGFTVGTLSGYAFSDNRSIRTVGNNDGTGGITNTQLNVAQGRRPASITSRRDDFTSFGGGVGYDYQFGVGSGIVVGAAADATLMGIGRRRGYAGPPVAGAPDISSFRQELDYLGTVRGRIGYAFDRFLVYGTGGLAFGSVFERASFYRNTDGALAYLGRYTGTETGYAYGGGVEYAIPVDSFLNKFSLLNYVPLFKTDAVTVKAEFLHYDLGSHSVLVSSQIAGGPTGSYTSRFNTQGDVIRGGFTYRFSGL